MVDINEPSNIDTIAVIVAIEDYRFADKRNGINSVKFARNDATQFKNLLQEEFEIPEGNIIMWLDNSALKSALEDELKYHIRQLKKTNRFIFYYAGHGFYQNGSNMLTCWDTHTANLSGTTVSIKDILLDPLENSDCQQSLIFLDCCSSILKESLLGRDLISNFNDNEFETFAKSKNYHALFMSCSPGEKSYPSDILKHGIWTYHLIEALKGNIPEARVKDIYITDNSIKNYLSNAVPIFITKNTTHKDTQQPYSKIYATNEFIIRKLPLKKEASSVTLPKFTLLFENAIFRNIIDIPIREGKGFSKNHFPPTNINSSGNSFVQRVFEDNLRNEIQIIYDKTKNTFSLRKKQIKITVEEGSGSLECDIFRYFISVEQSSSDPTLARITRKLVIRVKRNSLIENFNSIFPQNINEIVIPYVGKFDFDDLVEKFENLRDKDGGYLSDNELKGEIEYKTNNGLSIKINTEQLEVAISTIRTTKITELIDTSIDGLKIICPGKIKLLN